MSDSESLFHSVSACAARWVYRHGTRDGIEVARAAMIPALTAFAETYFAEGGEWVDESVTRSIIEKIARYRAKAGHGEFLCRARGTKALVRRVGLGAHPHGDPRPGARADIRWKRIALAGTVIEEFKGRGRGHGGRPSDTQVIAEAKQRGMTITRAAVDGARTTITLEKSLRRIRAEAAMSLVDRQLADALRPVLPAKSLTVIMLADVAAWIWSPSINPSTQGVHRKRAADMLLRIGKAGIGLTVAIVGRVAVIGRQRRIPIDPKAFVMAATPKRLRSGTLPCRGGLLETLEGQAALELADYHSHRMEEIADTFYAHDDGELTEEVLEGLAAKSLHAPLDIRRFCDDLDYDLLRDEKLCQLLGVEDRKNCERRSRFRLLAGTWDEAVAAHETAFADIHRWRAEGMDLAQQFAAIYARNGVKPSRSARTIMRRYLAGCHDRYDVDKRIVADPPRRPGRRPGPRAARQPYKHWTGRTHVKLATPRRDWSPAVKMSTPLATIDTSIIAPPRAFIDLPDGTKVEIPWFLA